MAIISEALLLLLLLLLHLTISFSTSSPSPDCKVSTCTGGATPIPVRFPFRLAGRHPRNCGYTPGFDLRCNSQGLTTLQLSAYTAGGEDYIVRSIDYLTRRVWINVEQGNCLPKRILTLDLSNSPFSAAFYHNYTFLHCPTTTTHLVRSRRFATIACLSNSTTSVLATSSASSADFLTAATTSSCEVGQTVRVPASWPVPFGGGSALEDDVMLVWGSPDCAECESQGGLCGFKNNSSRVVIGCTGVSSKSGLKVLKVLSLSLAIPAAACATGIACFAFFFGRGHRGANIAAMGGGGGGAGNHRNPATAIMPEPEPMVVMVGLDESMIESYEKVVLGESKRVPGPNDTACAICLTEYCSKDTIRLIPECRHCFHAECIDEWLRMNTTCPVCRNSPSSPANPIERPSV